jgi:hypothetical protein
MASDWEDEDVGLNERYNWVSSAKPWAEERCFETILNIPEA